MSTSTTGSYFLDRFLSNDIDEYDSSSSDSSSYSSHSSDSESSDNLKTSKSEEHHVRFNEVGYITKANGTTNYFEIIFHQPRYLAGQLYPPLGFRKPREWSLTVPLADIKKEIEELEIFSFSNLDLACNPSDFYDVD